MKQMLLRMKEFVEVGLVMGIENIGPTPSDYSFIQQIFIKCSDIIF